MLSQWWGQVGGANSNTYQLKRQWRWVPNVIHAREDVSIFFPISTFDENKLKSNLLKVNYLQGFIFLLKNFGIYICIILVHNIIHIILPFQVLSYNVLI